MVSVLASRATDRVFESRSCQTNDYKIGIYCFSAKSDVLLLLRSKGKDGLARNRNNVFEWNMSTHGPLFQFELSHLKTMRCQ